VSKDLVACTGVASGEESVDELAHVLEKVLLVDHSHSSFLARRAVIQAVVERAHDMESPVMVVGKDDLAVSEQETASSE
jgi:hypothetical protein